MSIETKDRDAIIELYIAYFNRVPEAKGLAYWTAQFEQGMSLPQISNAFYEAAVQFSGDTGYSATMSNADFVKKLYENVLARSGATAPNSSEVSYWSDQLDQGSLSKSQLVAQMLKDAKAFAGDPAFGWVATMLQNKLNAGVEHAVTLGINYDTSSQSILKGKQYLNDALAWQSVQSSGLTGQWYQLGDTLASNAKAVGQVMVDLASNTLTDSGVSLTLAKGSMPAAIHVNLSSLSRTTPVATGHQVVVIGDEQANTIHASGFGDQIRAGVGQDILVLGAGVDRIQFEASASTNGQDQIHQFTLGTDLLDLSALLSSATGAATLVSNHTGSNAALSWKHGELLVLQGSQLNTAADIVGYFGANKPFAASSSATNALLITADTTGDAQLWYLANQTDTAQISMDELIPLATLHDVNNLLTSTALAQLKNSVVLGQSQSNLTASAASMRESSANQGGSSDVITFTLTGDSFVGLANGSTMSGVTVSGVPAGLTARVVKLSDTQAELTFTGKATAHSFADSTSLSVAFAASAFTSGQQPTNNQFAIGLSFFDVYAQQQGSLLTLSNELTNHLSIDLVNNRLLFGDQPSGVFGDMTLVSDVNLSQVTSLSPYRISVLGDDGVNVITASQTIAGSYRAGAGNDVITLSERSTLVSDTLIFEASQNGIDSINNFKLGALADGGDRLDFTNFLTLANKSNIAPIDATIIANQTIKKTWTNGDVLVVQGDFADVSGHLIPTAKQEIAKLFANANVAGTTGVFAAPTGLANLIVIAADIVGDATVWAITNAGSGSSALGTADLGEITTDEITQIATLVGVNNLVINPVLAANLV